MGQGLKAYCQFTKCSRHLPKVIQLAREGQTCSEVVWPRLSEHLARSPLCLHNRHLMENQPLAR